MYLESNNHISEYRSGFRTERSTNDNLIRLETFIRNAFIKKEHVVAIFFDLEKAYDTTWRYGILKDLHDIGLEGHLSSFKVFLKTVLYRCELDLPCLTFMIKNRVFLRAFFQLHYSASKLIIS